MVAAKDLQSATGSLLRSGRLDMLDVRGGRSCDAAEVAAGSALRERAWNEVFNAMERRPVMNNSSKTRPAPATSVKMIDRLLADCFQPVSPRSIDRYSDSPRVRGLYAAFVEAFPDATFTPLWSVADGDRVAVGGVTRAIHGGTWRDVPATGRSIEVLSTVMFETSDGGVVDLMVVTDSLAIAEQLGAVEPLGSKACELLPAGTVRAARTPCGGGLVGGREART